MRSTGIIKRVDEIRRIAIPKEIREILGIAEGSVMEIFLNNNEIVFRKCNNNENCITTVSSKIVEQDGKYDTKILEKFVT